jgi:hypothetical protein
MRHLTSKCGISATRHQRLIDPEAIAQATALVPAALACSESDDEFRALRLDEPGRILRAIISDKKTGALGFFEVDALGVLHLVGGADY